MVVKVDLYFNNLFNDASRILEGGLWYNATPVGNQGHGTGPRYTNDLTSVQNTLAGYVAAGDFTPQNLVDVQKIQADLVTALANVQGAVNNDATAEHALRAAHLDIISVVANNADLTNMSIKDGNLGFNPEPAALATPVTHHTPHATFAELGAIFNDAANAALGGINADNLGQITKDLTIVHNGLEHLIATNPQDFAGATGIHAQTIVDQLHLQLTNFDHQYGVNPDAAKSSNDNFLDITDIVVGDPNLASMATANGAVGWTPVPSTDIAPVRYLDNADQTNFWADFIASSNTLGNQAIALVTTGSHAAIEAFEKVLTGWETNIANFDKAQGGIFEARFDNELIGKGLSTVGADVAAMIKGLDHHDAALVAAAAAGFHANAADVSGNNQPLGLGAYNADGLTVAQALSTAGTPLPGPITTPLTPATPTTHDHDGPSWEWSNPDLSHMHGWG